MALLGLSEGPKPEYSGYSTDLVTDAPRALGWLKISSLPGQLPPSSDVTGHWSLLGTEGELDFSSESTFFLPPNFFS